FPDQLYFRYCTIVANVIVYDLLRNFSRSALRLDEPFTAKIPLEKRRKAEPAILSEFKDSELCENFSSS
ncbi:hypothetical protein ACU8DI_15350, partial [Psychroserpens sp. BH13MA-6]